MGSQYWVNDFKRVEFVARQTTILFPFLDILASSGRRRIQTIYGAILGDMIGAPYEFDRGNKTKEFSLFGRGTQYTDDSVMTIAVAEALMDSMGKSDDEVKAALVLSMQKWGHKYPMSLS